LEDLLIDANLFEYDMDYFLDLRELAANYVLLLLNASLKETNVQIILRKFPLKFPFYVYANEHDSEEQSVFYLEK